MDYTVTLHDHQPVAIEARDTMLATYRATLEQELGDAAGVIAAYRAWTDIMQRYGEWPLPEEAEYADVLASDRWTDADHAAYRAALIAGKQDLGYNTAYFRIEIAE